MDAYERIQKECIMVTTIRRNIAPACVVFAVDGGYTTR